MNIIKVFKSCFPQLVRGLFVTIEITTLSLAIAVIIGFIVCTMSISHKKWVSFLGKAYVSLIRGTPLIVQVFFVYFALPQLIQQITRTNFRISSAFVAGLISLSLNAGAYISEIFRGGIEAVDFGQVEAADSLGVSRRKAMIKIVFPQALKISAPSLVNQFIITLKDTSIISVISLKEIVYEAKVYIGNSMETLGTWTIVAVLYFVVITILSKISFVVERKLNYENKG